VLGDTGVKDEVMFGEIDVDEGVTTWPQAVNTMVKRIAPDWMRLDT